MSDPTGQPMETPQGQELVFAFLADPATHGLAVPVDRVDTHGAVVFLAGEDVYKVKRAVRFAYMDLSTLPLRRAACAAELAVNRRFAPEFYLGCLPITQQANGLAIDGDGAVLEWVVHMRRFDERMTFDHLVARGEVDPRLLDRLAATLLQAHAAAPVRAGFANADHLANYHGDNLRAFRTDADLFPPSDLEQLDLATKTALESGQPAMAQRSAGGRVRLCHGDLHLRNIVLDGGPDTGRPVLFDAIEFDQDIATCDVLYDLAFLLMDMADRGQRAGANHLLNRYLWGAPQADYHAIGLLPLFLSLRAAIRGKVAVDTLAHLKGTPRIQAREEAARYFRFACDALVPPAPLVVAIGGLSGSGKTAAARGIAPALGGVIGGLHLRSDIERKRLFEIPEGEALPPTAYKAEINHKIGTLLGDKTRMALDAGLPVIIDATHLQPAARNAIEAVAAAAQAPFIGLWLAAPAQILFERVAARRGDASDADAKVVAGQLRHREEITGWHRIDASGPPQQTLAQALAILAANRPPSGPFSPPDEDISCLPHRNRP